MIVPLVSVVIKPVTALKSVAKKLVVVPLVVRKFVVEAVTAEILPVAVALERVTLPNELRPVTESVPVAMMLVVERLDVEALPRNEVFDVIVVNTGFGDTEIVEVEERTMLVPAVKYVTGELKILFHCVVEAVSGTEYPDAVAILKLWLEPDE